MSDPARAVFVLSETYAFSEDGGSAPLIPTEGFWSDLMSGAPRTRGAQRVSQGEGWLTGLYPVAQGFPTPVPMSPTRSLRLEVRCWR